MVLMSRCGVSDWAWNGTVKHLNVLWIWKWLNLSNQVPKKHWHHGTTILLSIWAGVLWDFHPVCIFYSLKSYISVLCSLVTFFLFLWCRQSIWIKTKGKLTDDPALHRYYTKTFMTLDIFWNWVISFVQWDLMVAQSQKEKMFCNCTTTKYYWTKPIASPCLLLMIKPNPYICFNFIFVSTAGAQLHMHPIGHS